MTIYELRKQLLAALEKLDNASSQQESEDAKAVVVTVSEDLAVAFDALVIDSSVADAVVFISLMTNLLVGSMASATASPTVISAAKSIISSVGNFTTSSIISTAASYY